MGRLTFHPLVEIFPQMEKCAFAAFVADVKENGVREPIVIHKGQILDGRNRWLACQRLGIECPRREYDGKESAKALLAFVLSANLQRRHLSESQRAMVAGKIANMTHGGDRKSDQAANLPLVSQADAGKRMGVSERSVRDAVKVLSGAAPEVARAVDNGGLVVSVAAQLTDHSAEFQRQVVAKIVNGEAATSAEAIRQVRNIEAASKLNSIEALEAKKLAGVYDVAVIDPPWPMDRIERDTSPEQVSYDYPVMDVATITSEVGAHLAEHLAVNAHVFLWTTQKYLPLAFGMIEQWDLAYGETLVWHKNGGFQPFGAPQYNCEFVIHARRGSPVFLDTKNFPTCFNAPRAGHSEKPEEFYAVLRRVTGGRRLDMYNRRRIEGFEGWGKETASSAGCGHAFGDAGAVPKFRGAHHGRRRILSTRNEG
jgi:N6-adenosine-specific RNA methylase IME4/ParB-like chromosome segregation protein Spo0J